MCDINFHQHPHVNTAGQTTEEALPSWLAWALTIGTAAGIMLVWWGAR